MLNSQRPSLCETSIFVAGHLGLVGSSVVEALQEKGCQKILTASRREVDLTRQQDVEEFFLAYKPQVVVLAAAKVGGIGANQQFPAEFIYQNLMIEANVIHQAYVSGVERLVFLGSSCIYPKQSQQPITPEALLTGALEPTNQPYAVAKIAGIEMCRAYNRQYGTKFLSLMPTNLYGFADNFCLETSHVLPALLRKLHEAKVTGEESVTLWGTGKPRREFLHAKDLAKAILFLLEAKDEEFLQPDVLNVGTGVDLSIEELATMIKEVVGWEGRLIWDKSRPDGTYRKVLDISQIQQKGWEPLISLREGIEELYKLRFNHTEFSL